MDTYCFYNWKDTVIYTLHFKLFKIKQNFPHSAAVFISLVANNFISAPWLGEVWASWQMLQTVPGVKLMVTENRSQASYSVGTELFQNQTELSSNLKAINYRPLDKFPNCSESISSSETGQW